LIRAVTFDVGGVLCPSPLDEFGKVDAEYGLPAGTVMDFIRGGDIFQRVETGRMPIAEFYRRCSESIAADHGITVPVERLDVMMDGCMGTSMRPEMLALVTEVKEAGYQTALLTNIFAERREWLHGLFADGIIDVFCDSSEVGLRKPEPPIYHKLLEMLGRPAAEVVFVDDFAENLHTACELGIATVLFESAEQVRSQLAGLGVTIDSGRA
jgi:epoxide hydrolase-like predicted phosphatase